MTRFFKKNAEYFPVLFLVALFIYMFAQNFVLSENWSIITIRQVDDYAVFIVNPIVKTTN